MSRSRVDNAVIKSPRYEGTQPIDGLNGMARIPVNTPVAALGTLISDAAQIYPGYTLVTGADDAKGVILQKGVIGDVYIIKVGDGADLKIWPPDAASSINLLTAANAMTVVDDVCLMIIKTTATVYTTLPLLPS